MVPTICDKTNITHLKYHSAPSPPHTHTHADSLTHTHTHTHSHKRAHAHPPKQNPECHTQLSGPLFCFFVFSLFFSILFVLFFFSFSSLPPPPPHTHTHFFWGGGVGVGGCRRSARYSGHVLGVCRRMSTCGLLGVCVRSWDEQCGSYRDCSTL